MATATLTNGHSHTNGQPRNRPGLPRFSDIPDAIDIVVSSDGEEEAVEVNLKDLPEDPTELCTLLENENVAKQYWQTTALAYAKQGHVDHAIEMVTKGMASLRGGRAQEERLALLSLLCWMWLYKCRGAPRVKPEGQLASEARTKDYYIQQATATLNEASRISPSYPPLFLARGVLSLLRASLQPPSKSAPGTQDVSERMETLRQALKCFEDATRASSGRNIMATMGKARVQFSLGKYADALRSYQEVLERAPELTDPDPRIGIGCCLWQLQHKDEALYAWNRALELTPHSKIANILLGLHYWWQASQHHHKDPEFTPLYNKAMKVYTSNSFKTDNTYPLACATFASYFVNARGWTQAEKLARRAIELTDVNAIASDGWYALARKEHFENDSAKANEFYLKADQARGGDERGYVPAKYGAAQIRVRNGDNDGAKFRLEKIVQQSKSIDAMMLLGTLYAEDVFKGQESGLKEDKIQEAKKAIALLENVRIAWKDSKRKIQPDEYVLLNLARLYEQDAPDKSLACLLQVEQMQIDAIKPEDRPEDIEDEVEMRAALREQVPPQLLNNIACFHYQFERYKEAQELFQSALQACVKAKDQDQDVDTDALVTTISFNLGRTYEAQDDLENARTVYEGLHTRHDEYVDANTRLAYIALKQDRTVVGPETMKELYTRASSDMEVRALQGWYLSKSKKTTKNIAEDSEQRHHKHTLQQYDKHDRYALTAIGSICLNAAREMRRDSDDDRRKRSAMYTRAVEFFDKALQLDPKNAYAAQGIGIAIAEDRKDYSGAANVFQSVAGTLGRNGAVGVNLGHVYVELKQYSRAVESYEAALASGRQNDPQLLACLGRVHYLAGKTSKTLASLQKSLEYSQAALAAAPEQVHFKFNIAFVQFQLAQTILQVSESQRSSEDLQKALDGLEESIAVLVEIAKGPSPPFPRGDIESRASMGKNTVRRQLERALASQKDFEQKDRARLEAARKVRQAEIDKRADEQRKREEEQEAQRRAVLEEREKMRERDREFAAQRAEEEKVREEAEMTTDSETGERRKRVKKPVKRKKKAEDDIIDDGPSGEESGRKSRKRTPRSGDEAEQSRKKKKRRLERKGKPEKSSKFKSAETINDSDEDDDDPAVAEMANNQALADKMNDSEAGASTPADTPMPDPDDEEDEREVAAPMQKARKSRAVIDEDEDDDEEEALDGLENGMGAQEDETQFGEKDPESGDDQ